MPSLSSFCLVVMATLTFAQVFKTLEESGIININTHPASETDAEESDSVLEVEPTIKLNTAGDILENISRIQGTHPEAVSESEIDDDNDGDKDYRPEDEDSDDESEIIPPSRTHSPMKKKIRLEPVIPDSAEENVTRQHQSENRKENAKTEKKRPRNREEKIAAQRQKHPLGEHCSCKMKCIEKIDEERRETIHKEYWNLDYNEQKAWIFHKIELGAKKIKNSSDRQPNTSYTFPNKNGENMKVCHKFFMATLGLTSDKIIKKARIEKCAGVVSPNADKRGRHTPSNKLSYDDIDSHIESYNPSISHYRREHAPNRRYLPMEVTVKDMHKDFVQKTGTNLSYEVYRQRIRAKNISFVKLGEEECEMCLLYDKHSHNTDGTDGSCTDCVEWKKHVDSAMVVRHMYQADASSSNDNSDRVCVSADMQKVMLLPIIPGSKTSIFTRRLVVFHETFAPLGSSSKQKPIGVLWDESQSGRDGDDIASAFVYFLILMRDFENVLAYVDNCTSQNKNWSLFSALVNHVNLPTGQNTVTLRYLEKGHTFMSADAFHAQVSKQIKRKGNVYDFADLLGLVNSVGEAHQLDTFTEYKSLVSSAKDTKKPLLSSVKEVQFRKGSSLLYWKEDLREEVFQSGEFLQKKIRPKLSDQLFPPKTVPRGIPPNKKKAIVDKLVPLMPSNRQQFWDKLPTAADSADLLDE